MTKEKQLIYILVCSGVFTISFNIAAISAIVPEIANGLALDDLSVAKIIPYYLMPYGFGALIYAPLTRFVSYRKVYCVTFLLYAFFCLVCGLSRDLNVILLGRVGMGLTASAAAPLGLMLIGDVFDKEIRGRLVGFFFSCAFIASIIGLILAGQADWPWLFYVPSGIALILVMAFFVDRSPLLSGNHVGHINYIKAFQNKEIFKVFSFIFVISFLYHGVHKWYGVYLSQVYAFNKETISFFVILTVVAGMIGQNLGGFLSDKKGRVFTCQVGVVGLAVSVMMLINVHSSWLLGVVLSMVAFFWTIGHNGILTVLTDFSSENRPVIASLNSSVRFISGGLGFWMSSYFIAISFSMTFFVIGCLMLGMFFLINKLIPSAK